MHGWASPLAMEPIGLVGAMLCTIGLLFSIPTWMSDNLSLFALLPPLLALVASLHVPCGAASLVMCLAAMVLSAMSFASASLPLGMVVCDCSPSFFNATFESSFAFESHFPGHLHALCAGDCADGYWRPVLFWLGQALALCGLTLALSSTLRLRLSAVSQQTRAVGRAAARVLPASMRAGTPGGAVDTAGSVSGTHSA